MTEVANGSSITEPAYTGPFRIPARASRQNASSGGEKEAGLSPEHLGDAAQDDADGDMCRCVQKFVANDQAARASPSPGPPRRVPTTRQTLLSDSCQKLQVCHPASINPVPNIFVRCVVFLEAKD